MEILFVRLSRAYSLTCIGLLFVTITLAQEREIIYQADFSGVGNTSGNGWFARGFDACGGNNGFFGTKQKFAQQ